MSPLRQPSTATTPLLGWMETPSVKSIVTLFADSHSNPKTKAYQRMMAFSIFPLVLGLVYFFCRLWQIIASCSTMNIMTLLVAGLFLCVELAFAALPMFMGLLYWTAPRPYQPRLPKRLLGDDVPRVDLLLPCCGEDIDIVLDTIKAALYMDYPHDKLRILVLDDGSSAQLQTAVEQLQLEFEVESIFYAARGGIVRFHSKAANLDFGLDHLRQLDNRDPAPYFAVLDIDMIPDPQWLRASLPSLLEDNKIALINTPQRWYNLPSSYSIADRCIHNQDIGEHLLGQSGNANCVGTGFVARRAAFEFIGGYPHTPLQDDTVVPSYMLKARGWDIVQLPESMQHGLQVVKLGDIAKQQAKWMLGHLATVGLVFGAEMRDSTFQRKLGMLFTIWNWGISRMLLVFATAVMPVLVFYSSIVIPTGDATEHTLLLGLAAAWQMSLYAQAYFERQATGGHVGLENDRRLWVLPYEVQGALRLCKKKMFGSEKRKAFKSTGAESSETEDPLLLPLHRRFWHVFWHDEAYYHATYAIVLVGAMALAAYHTFATKSTTAIFSLTYPPLTKILVECISQATIPFKYILFAQPLQEREDLLIRDKASAVLPKEEAKQLPKIDVLTAYSSPTLVCGMYCFAFYLVVML